MSQLFVQDDSDEESLQMELSQQLQPQLATQSSAQLDVGHEYGNVIEGTTGDGNESMSRREAEEDVTLYPLIPDDADENDPYKPNIEDIRPVDVQLNLSLPFQQQVVENVLVTEDPLVLLGKGLGLIAIVANLLHILATPTRIKGQLKRSLVVVLNATGTENRQISEELEELNWLVETQDLENGDDHGIYDPEADDDEGDDFKYSRFSEVTADTLSVEKRRQLYLTGGIVSVTSRIFIVDLLSGTIHPNRITGFVILNVDNIKTFSNESFILEMYRSKNNWGFIKAFSNNPELFTMSFAPLVSKMKDLRLKNVLLWPRFRVEVSSSLNWDRIVSGQKFSNKVVEVRVSPTNSMSQIQFGLMECLKKCIEELNRKNTELSIDYWNVENVLDANFIKSIDAIMIPNWHRISFESKQLVKDIKFLKRLLKMLFSCDAVDFYEEVQLSLEANKPSLARKYSESPWLMADESQMVISYARQRIYDGENYVLEELPKWDQLLRIMDDITYEKTTKNIQGSTLIACSNKGIANQLRQILSLSDKKDGQRNVMLRKLEWYKLQRDDRKRMIKDVKKEEQETEIPLVVSTSFAKEEVVTKRRRTRGAAAVAAVQKLRTAGSGNDIEDAIENYNYIQEVSKITEGDGHDYVNELFSEFQENEHEDIIDDDVYDNFETSTIFQEFQRKEAEISADIMAKRNFNYNYVDRQDQLIVETFSRIGNEMTLEEIMPAYIVLYEPDLAFIRKVEIFRALKKEDPPKVFFLYYGDSVEEQSHLMSIKKEKDAFSKLIRENASLAQRFEAPEDLSHYKNLADRKLRLSSLRKTNTRMAGGQEGMRDLTQDIVIVDTREFNASLPGLLFRYGVRVVPCMLTVGDYIISPDICIERKSIADLIGSLQNNRLESQCRKMTRHYKYPTLLIEFDEGQSFSLEPFSERRLFKSRDSSAVHPISNKLSQDEIQVKLSKLVMKFPGLRIMWCSSPLQSVNVILELKLGREQPDPNIAINLGMNRKKTASSKNVNDNEGSFRKLLSLPILSKIDYFNIRKKVKSFSKLKKMRLIDLQNIVGNETVAKHIYEFLQKEDEDSSEDDILF
ncbi:ssDNA endodeoxyribonuclease RAD1 [Nakaseomyces bracarensis]|uniref:ssDNA endodeoxyribonuclease RAD1 n=1 Tax=Nakaseomyces bracarensis TaxID=273131 RepID=UPI003872336B